MTNLKKLFEQATARSWKARHGATYHGDTDELLLSSIGWKTEFKQAKANARLITLAANHFEAVTHTLKHLEAELQMQFDDVPAGVDAWMAEARSVLAAIEEDAGHV